jgi:cytochrome c oxidase subunit 3
MMFAALTSAMVVRHGAAGDWGHFRLPRILYVNTFVLVLSSITLEISRRRLAQQRDMHGEESTDHTRASARGLQLLYITMGLGLVFVCGQLLAWWQLAQQGLFLATLPSSSFFYVLTAVHGTHLLGGVLGLAYVLVRVRRGFGPSQKATVATASVYWHFMDGLWVYLMLLMILQWK